jgi:hypothetical protein
MGCFHCRLPFFVSFLGKQKRKDQGSLDAAAHATAKSKKAPKELISPPFYR